MRRLPSALTADPSLTLRCVHRPSAFAREAAFALPITGIPVAAAVLAPDLGWPVAVGVGAALGATVAVARLVSRRLQRDAMLVTSAGISPSSRSGVFVPREAVAGLELRRWSYRHEDEIGLSVRLTDGRYFQVPSLVSRPYPHSAVFTEAGPLVECSVDAEGTWTPLTEEGRPLGPWTASNDTAVLEAICGAVEPLLGGFGSDAAAARAVEGRELEDAGPIRTARHARQQIVFAGWIRRSHPLPR